MISLVCVPCRDKEGRLQADCQHICLTMICPLPSVPEVVCQEGVGQFPVTSSFICASGSPGPHGSHSEGRVCCRCWRSALWSPVDSREGRNYLAFLWLLTSLICLLAPGSTSNAILKLGHDIEMFSRNWAACRNDSDENLQCLSASHLLVRTSNF